MKTLTVVSVVAGGVLLGLAVFTGRPQSAVSTPPNPASTRPSPDSAGFVAHEWGTFTSFQGGDGNLLPWRPLETSKLPGFVYNWKQPGMNRTATSLLVGGKGQLDSLQRMETPVIYFYSDTPRTVDVTVDFPTGAITEWYPQASQIGPAHLNSAPNDSPDAASAESMIRWRNVHVGPLLPSDEYNMVLPLDNSGSHYFAARDTDADQVRLDPLSKNDPTPGETEKFLFYRGVGNFTTPLHVTMKTADAVEISNTGKETLTRLFVMAIKGNAGRLISVAELAPGTEKTVAINSGNLLPLEELANQVSGQMAAALATTGLFPREATAMVNTWRDSWFQEPGVRVLYALPRAWTDQTLPMQLNPAPGALVRTMVGRAEVLPPDIEANLVALFEKAAHGDQQASDEARRTLAGLGRFAYPAFNRVLAKVNPQPQESALLSALLTTAPAAN